MHSSLHFPPLPRREARSSQQQPRQRATETSGEAAILSTPGSPGDAFFPLQGRMAPLYKCPFRGEQGFGCTFEGRGRKLKRHIQRSSCHLFSPETFVFLRPDQIWYNGKGLLSYAHAKMYVYHLKTDHPYEGCQSTLLQSELDLLHYLELRQTRTHFAFQLTTGFDRKFANRLDAVFVLSPGLVSDWQKEYSFITTTTTWAYRPHTQQTAYVKYTMKKFLSFSNLYILLILHKEDYANDSVDLFRHSENGNLKR
jgi:hypothetical protein